MDSGVILDFVIGIIGFDGNVIIYFKRDFNFVFKFIIWVFCKVRDVILIVIL